MEGTTGYEKATLEALADHDHVAFAVPFQDHALGDNHGGKTKRSGRIATKWAGLYLLLNSARNRDQSRSEGDFIKSIGDMATGIWEKYYPPIESTRFFLPL